MSMPLFNKAAVCLRRAGLKWYWRAGFSACSGSRGELVQHSTKAPNSWFSWWKLVTLQKSLVKKVTAKQAAARQLWVWASGSSHQGTDVISAEPRPGFYEGNKLMWWQERVQFPVWACRPMMRVRSWAQVCSLTAAAYTGIPVTLRTYYWLLL